MFTGAAAVSDPTAPSALLSHWRLASSSCSNFLRGSTISSSEDIRFLRSHFRFSKDVSMSLRSDEYGCCCSPPSPDPSALDTDITFLLSLDKASSS